MNIIKIKQKKIEIKKFACDIKQTHTLLPVRYVDPLYYLPGTPLTLVGRRGFCPSDQIFYRHVFVGCFRPRFAVVVPKNDKIRTQMHEKVKLRGQ